MTRSPSTIAVIGAGPAGLMAAERLAQAGLRVVVHERMPSVARKFLMAGRGGPRPSCWRRRRTGGCALAAP